MATYTIIGGDQKPYSSVTADDIRRWIADGRLNAQSLAKEENDTEWRPLSAFPEFADVLAASSAPPPPLTAPVAGAGDGRDAALQLVKGPAIGLISDGHCWFRYSGCGGFGDYPVSTVEHDFNIGLQQIHDPQIAETFIEAMHGRRSGGLFRTIIGGLSALCSDRRGQNVAVARIISLRVTASHCWPCCRACRPAAFLGCPSASGRWWS